jgi:hypothetical protein
MKTLLVLNLCLLSLTGFSDQASQVSTSSNSAANAHISFETTVFDFGKVNAGEVVRHDFIFTNTGMARLEITDVHPGCGCTTAGTWDKSVEPGKTGKIPLQFNSTGFGGMVSKSATVTCNDPEHTTSMLQLNGTVWKPIALTPSMVVFNVPSDAQTSEVKTIKIVNNTEQPLSISDLQCTNKQFQVELKAIIPGKEFDVEVTSRPPFETGTVMALITAKTSYAAVPVLTMNAYLMVQPPIVVSPAQLMLPSGPLTNSKPYFVTIRNQSTNSFQISDVKVNIPGAEVKLTEIQPGRVANLTITFPAGFQLKQGERNEISFATSHPKYPHITVPILQAFNSGRPVVEAQSQGVIPKVRSLSGRPPKPELQVK